MSDRSPSSRLRRGAVCVIGLLLVIAAVASVDTARQMTVTHDEYWHIPVGLLNLQTGRFHYDSLNPPLVRLLSAVPNVAENPGAVPEEPELFRIGDDFLQANPQRYHDLVFRARLPIVALMLGCGVVLAVWSWRLFGPRSASVTVLLWSCSPNILANGAVVTTDLGAAVFFVATIAAAWWFAEAPSWRTAVLLGMLLGLAQLVKFTCLLLYPLALATWFVLRVRDKRRVRLPVRTSAGLWLAAIVLSGLVLNAGYLFQGTGTRFGSYRFASRTLTELQRRLGGLHALPVPVPRDYVEGIDRQRRMMEADHPVFLDGEWKTHGFPAYYLLTLWYKVPHATQLMILLALIVVLRAPQGRRTWRTQCILLLPVVALLGLASASGMQLGLRYILAVLPFLFVFAGQAAQWAEPDGPRRRRLGPVLVGLLLLASLANLRFHPHHLSYFNELAGGPIGGREHLVDSNLDWGQDLGILAEQLQEKEIKPLGLAYFGMFPPAALGIDYALPPSDMPAPGWYAVSVNFVQGRPHTIREPDGSIRSADIGQYQYFRLLEPEFRAGYSIDVYHVRKQDVARCRAQMREAGLLR